MKFRIYFIKVFILLSVKLFAQNSDYIGLELGKNFYQYKEIDTGKGLYETLGDYNVSYGVQYLHRINRHIIFETGLNYMIYYQQYGTMYSPGAHNEIYKSILIPLRINYSVALLKNRLEFNIYTGYSQGIKLDKYTNNYTSLFYDGNTGLYDSITRGTFYNNKNRFYGIVDLGGRIIINLHRRFALSMNANVGKGLGSIAALKFYYNNGSGKNDHYAEQHNYGHYHNFRVGLNYRFYRKKQT